MNGYWTSAVLITFTFILCHRKKFTTIYSMSKPEFLILGEPRDLAKLPTVAVSVGDEAISPSKTARNIGAYIWIQHWS